MGQKYRDLVRQFSTAKGSDRSVLNILADYAGDDGEAWPAVETLANDTGLSERTVQRALQRLVDSGRLIVVAHAHGGRGRPTRYLILIPEKGDTVTPYEAAERVTSSTQKGDSVTQKGDILSEKGDILSEKGDTVTPEPYEPQEPQDEPEGDRAVNHHRHSQPPQRADASLSHFWQPRQFQKPRAAARPAEIMAKVRALGAEPALFRAMTDQILIWTGRREVADLENDVGDRELYEAQECTLALLGMGFNSTDAIEMLESRFKKAHQYFTTPPSYRQIIRFGGELQAGKHEQKDNNHANRWQRGKEARTEYEPERLTPEQEQRLREWQRQRAEQRQHAAV